MVDFSVPLNLKSILDRGLKLPVSPVVFTKLTGLLNEPDADTNKLVALISTEPVLSAQILRQVNSPFYALKRKITAVQQAVFQLGFSEVASLVAALKAKEMLNGLGWSPFNEILWKHSVKTAEIAHVLGQWMKDPLSESFFTAGLLHDLGKVVLHQVDKNYAALSKNGAVTGMELVKLEQKSYGTDHARLGAELHQFWNLSPSIVKLVEGHHEPPNAKDSLYRPRCFFSLANEIAYVNATDEDWLTKLQGEPRCMNLVSGTGLEAFDFDLLKPELQRRLEREDRFSQ